MQLQIYLHPEGNGIEAQQFLLPMNGGNLILGRGPESPIPLDGTKISRDHLAFTVERGELTVTDLSSNGVWINGDPAPKNRSVRVTILDEIAIPGYKLYANIENQHAETPAETAPASTPLAGVDKPVSPPTSEIEPLPAPKQPPVWKPSGGETFILVLVGLAIALIAYYYALQ